MAADTGLRGAQRKRKLAPTADSPPVSHQIGGELE